VGPLSNDEVIRNIAANFVPIAVNTRKVRDKSIDTPATRFFREVNAQTTQTQGVWIVAPEGKVLAAYHGPSDLTERTRGFLETIDAGLKAFGEVTPREFKLVNPLPYRGAGVEEDGQVTLAISIRGTNGGGQPGHPVVVEEHSAWLWKGEFRQAGYAIFDSVTFTAEEWATFAPAQTEVGAEWTIPVAVASQLARVVAGRTDRSTMFRAEDAKLAKLTCKVEALNDGVARIRLIGGFDAVHAVESNKDKPVYGQAVAEGIALYDVNRRSMQSLLLVFHGTFRDVPPHDKTAHPVSAAVEWRAR